MILGSLSCKKCLTCWLVSCSSRSRWSMIMDKGAAERQPSWFLFRDHVTSCANGQEKLKDGWASHLITSLFFFIFLRSPSYPLPFFYVLLLVLHFLLPHLDFLFLLIAAYSEGWAPQERLLSSASCFLFLPLRLLFSVHFQCHFINISFSSLPLSLHMLVSHMAAES